VRPGFAVQHGRLRVALSRKIGEGPSWPATDRTMPDPSIRIATTASDPGSTERRQHFSQVLSDLAIRPVDATSIGDILDAFGNKAFGALMLLFAAPNVLPLPPGLSAVLGAPLLFVTAQLMLGRSSLWMPRFICKRSIARDVFAVTAAKFGPILRQSERWLRPRMPALLHPVPERIVGAVCLLLAIILFLPIPFGNIAPAFAISVFALGILERDGLAILVGWFATAGSLLVLAAISSAILAGVSSLFAHLWALA
jgi:hypothetical protein